MKQRVDPAEFAEMLLQEFVGKTSLLSDSLPVLDEAALKRLNDKVCVYGIALMLMALGVQEEGDMWFASVRAEVERRIFPPTPTPQAETMVTQLKNAMKILSELLYPGAQPKEMTWARNWLLDIGVNETNPVNLTMFAMHWLNAYIAVSKAITTQA